VADDGGDINVALAGPHPHPLARRLADLAEVEVRRDRRGLAELLLELTQGDGERGLVVGVLPRGATAGHGTSAAMSTPVSLR
jgi:hypothetical protein